MKIASLLVVTFALIQQPTGCDQPTPKETLKPAEPPIRRFEPVTSHGTSDVALDTKTGRLCRTWDWEYKNNPEANDLNDLPTCYSIFTSEQQSPIVVTPEDMKKNP
ncbi:MAG TPA: hypothetical protein VHX20_20255 [Terracidiphilus sp.]|jgi:hypothetical protein|nr:hypothetical protein [Terracidiphilus sp.]